MRFPFRNSDVRARRSPISILARATIAALACVAGAALSAGCGKKNPVEPPTHIAPVDSIRISPRVDTLRVGDIRVFSAAAYDSVGILVSPAPLVWASRDSSVISVNGQGRVRALAEGTTYVVASADSARDSARVTVVAAVDGWYSQVSNASVTLNGVFFLPDGRNGWVVGNTGKIMHTTNSGTTWSAQVSNSNFNLNAVTFPHPDTGWVVGDAGHALKTVDAGATWAPVTNINRSEELTDVFFATSRHGWIVGSLGLILRTSDGGLTWTRTQPTPTSVTLNSVSFADTSNGWAVGNAGTILGTHDGGRSWFLVTPTPTSKPLNAVSQRSRSLAIAAGTPGAAPRNAKVPPSSPDSSFWMYVSASDANQLEGASLPTDLVGYVVGFNINGFGAVLRSDDAGVSWTQQSSNVQYRLNDVYFVDANRGWAVGDAGTIVHTSSGGRP